MKKKILRAEAPQSARESADQEPSLSEAELEQASSREDPDPENENDSSESAGNADGGADAYFAPQRRRKHKVLRALGAALALVFIVMCSAAVFIGVSGLADNRHFEMTFYHITCANIDHSMRIVLLSDLHSHEYGKKNSELLESIEAVRPDMICIVGDMMNNYETDYHVVIDLLSALQEKKIAPVFYAYGNHENDYIYNVGEQLDRDIKATGVAELRNRYATLSVAGNTVSVAGLTTAVQDYEKYGAADMMKNFQKAPGFRLLLAHYPHYFTDIFHGENAIDADLALCGHAHGGIIRLPKLGGLYASGQGVFPELSEGLAQYGRCKVIVSRGLGGRAFPIRINNKPELVVIDVGRAN